MGGRAFKSLHTPRISRDVYLKVHAQTTKALLKLFTHVAVPAELPSKTDFGDVDFLVAGPIHAAHASPTLDWDLMVAQVKEVLGTGHGRRGFLTENVMFFAVPAPAPSRDDEFWVQVDVKVCAAATSESFEWDLFQLRYASAVKMLGSMVKPLGLSITPEGLHIRVEDMEGANLPGSMVFLTKDPWEVLKIAGLDRRFLNGGIGEDEELYRYLCGSWLFNPAHFAERLKDEGYTEHLKERSPHWVVFVMEWVPEHYPIAQSGQDASINDWYKKMRAALREEVFTAFPYAALDYYNRRGAHSREVEEHRLRRLIMGAIPSGGEGWRDDFPQPPIIPKTLLPSISQPHRTSSEDPRNTRRDSAIDMSVEIHIPTIPLITIDCPNTPWDTTLYLDQLPRVPERPYVARPPESKMSLDAKILCLARWTAFNPDRTLSILHEAREKKFEMCWVNDVPDDELVKWAREMWWVIWTRQHRSNYVGMWKKRMEKQDAKARKRAGDVLHAQLGSYGAPSVENGMTV